MNDNDYCNRVDATAERGGVTERLVIGVMALNFGGLFVAMVALVVWRWIS